MKKLLSLLMVALTLACVLSVAGCDNGKKTDSIPSSTATTLTATTTAPSTSATTLDKSTMQTTTEPSTTTPEPSTVTTTVPPTTVTTPPQPEPEPDQKGINGVDYEDKSNWNRVVNNVYTSDKGGLQMKADGWKTCLANDQLSMIASSFTGENFANAIAVAVYDPDSEAVFSAKTVKDFENVLLTTIDTFEAITVDGYPAYKATKTNEMYVYVINTPNHKYFINFLQAIEPYGTPVEAAAEAMIKTAVIYK